MSLILVYRNEGSLVQLVLAFQVLFCEFQNLT